MRSGGQLAVVLAARAQRGAVQAGVVGLRFGSVERGQERAEGSPPWRAKARAATLYSVGSAWDPDHEAAIRFEGEAPGRRAHSVGGVEATAISGHRHLGS